MATLKNITALRANLKLKSQSLETIKAKFTKASRSGDNKPSEYGQSEEYTELFKLGPVVNELADAIKALESEIEDLHTYMADAVGSDSSALSVGDAGTTITSDADGSINFNFTGI